MKIRLSFVNNDKKLKVIIQKILIFFVFYQNSKALYVCHVDFSRFMHIKEYKIQYILSKLFIYLFIFSVLSVTFSIFREKLWESL